MNVITSLIRAFIMMAGVILVTTGCAKIISAMGDSAILKTLDPIFLVSFRSLFWTIGTIELMVAAICFFGKNVYFKINLLALLGTGFIVYRSFSLAAGYHLPCHCLGTFTDSLHISLGSAEMVMKIAAGILFFGSYGSMVSLWSGRRFLDEKLTQV